MAQSALIHPSIDEADDLDHHPFSTGTASIHALAGCRGTL